MRGFKKKNRILYSPLLLLQASQERFSRFKNVSNRENKNQKEDFILNYVVLFLNVIRNELQKYTVATNVKQHTWHWFELIKSHVTFITMLILLWNQLMHKCMSNGAMERDKTWEYHIMYEMMSSNIAVACLLFTSYNHFLVSCNGVVLKGKGMQIILKGNRDSNKLCTNKDFFVRNQATHFWLGCASQERKIQSYSILYCECFAIFFVNFCTHTHTILRSLQRLEKHRRNESFILYTRIIFWFISMGRRRNSQIT